MTFFAGDEVSALVLDVGTSSVKAGYAGEDTPKAVFPSFVGVLHQSGEGEVGSGPMAIDEGEGSAMSLANETKIKYFCGINQLGRRDGMEMEPAMKHGLVHNWDALEKLWDHALCERLGMRSREHPVLLTEPAFNTKEIREKYTEIFFEKYDVPAFFVAKDPVCSCFANGRSTGLVLDVGAEVTCVTPVHDGYALRKGISRSLLAGDRLSDAFLHHITSKGNTVLPRYSIKRKLLSGGKFEIQTLDFPLTTESYRMLLLSLLSRIFIC
jgi:actin-like protein 6A